MEPRNSFSEPQSGAQHVPFLAQSDLFSSLPARDLETMAEHMQARTLSKGECLIRQGDPGDSLYVILEGRFRVTQQKEGGEECYLRTLDPGMSVGEIALLTGERRSASVHAEGESAVLCLDHRAFQHIRHTNPRVATRCSQIVVDRLYRGELQDLLHASGSFQDMKPAALGDLESELELILFPGGSCLMREGEESDCSYIVVSGRLRVSDSYGEGAARLLCELGRGQAAGEIAILAGGKRTATVTAIRDTLVAKLSMEAFLRLLRKHPQDMVRHFAGRVIKRLWMQTIGKSGELAKVVNIAIVPVQRHVCLDAFTRRLTQALSQHGPTLRLSRDLLDDYLSPKGSAETPFDDPNSMNITRWLNRQESSYCSILYQTDFGSSEWTKRCLRQADRILLVVDAASRPAHSEIEALLSSDPHYEGLPRSLVLLHPSSGGPCRKTSAWLTDRKLACHYHVCLSEPSDMARLGRLLSGKGVGLVLSGGGARGFAHIGAVRAIREAGIPIDRVGGTSIGSIVSAMAALLWDHRTMLEQATTFRYRMDYTFPAIAVTAGRNLTTQLRKRFGELEIEDLWINFYCVSTDLSTSRPHVHDRGLVWKSVRASTSIPGLFPPVIDGASLLVDGAIVNNMPVDIMRSYEDIGTIIAVDVSAPERFETQLPSTGSVSGWGILAQWLMRSRPRVVLPSLPKILVLSALTKSAEISERMKKLADFYLQLPVGDYGMLDFNKLRSIAETGYSYTRDQVAHWSQRPTV